MHPLWREVWEKHRVPLSRLGGLFLLLIAKPRSNFFFMNGFWIVVIGQAIRFWAAGHIRKGVELASDGPYAMTRNPLYVGSAVMSIGFAAICTSWRSVSQVLSTAIIWGAVWATFQYLYPKKIEMEEEDLAKAFPQQFSRFRDQVPPFWPDWSRFELARSSSHWEPRLAIKNKEHRTLWAVLGLLLLLRLKMVYRW